MTRIRISPEQVRELGFRFHSAGDQTQEVVDGLRGYVGAVSDDWAGLTKERFFQDFQQWQGAMRDFVEMLHEIGRELDTIARRFEEVDQA